MINTLRTIKEVDLADKHILLRAGWDVPLEKSKIIVMDDLRIRESLPTIRYLLEHGVAAITIATHLGRPGGRIAPELSVRPVVERLVELLSEVVFHQNPNVKIPMSSKVQSPKSKSFGHSDFGFHLKLGFRILDFKIAGSLTMHKITGAPIPITILENLRFDPREETNDEAFAQELAHDHDLYVNDAFSNCHRAHASMVAITKFLPAYAGLTVDNEIKQLSILTGQPPRPLVVIIGGAKIEDKMAVIDEMAKTADVVLLGGKTGLQYKNSKLLTPNLLTANIYPPIDDIDGFDIGPKTVQLFIDKIKTAQTIFWNGNLGRSEKDLYADGTRRIAEAIVSSQATIKIAGGGDTTAFIHQNGLADQFTFLSSGGGATLDYLAGKEMPGLKPLLTKSKILISK